MTHACCPSCRLRFTSATGGHLDSCPTCSLPTQPIDAALIMGFQLVHIDDSADLSAEVLAAALPIPDPNGVRP